MSGENSPALARRGYASALERAVVFVGIDLAKRSFHLYGAVAAGRQVLSRKLTRKQLSALMA